MKINTFENFAIGLEYAAGKNPANNPNSITMIKLRNIIADELFERNLVGKNNDRCMNYANRIVCNMKLNVNEDFINSEYFEQICHNFSKLVIKTFSFLLDNYFDVNSIIDYLSITELTIENEK